MLIISTFAMESAFQIYYCTLHTLQRMLVYVVYRVLGLSSEYKEGILFCTYATLVSSVSKGLPFT